MKLTGVIFFAAILALASCDSNPADNGDNTKTHTKTGTDMEHPSADTTKSESSEKH